MVEFALTLPVLMLFFLTAIDLGRVFLGYVNMQNMVRIAANYASEHSKAWSEGDATAISIYRNEVLNDAGLNNCQLPVSSGVTEVAAPEFPDGTNLGGRARVTLTCKFDLMAPYWSWIGLFPDNAIKVSVTSEFPIRNQLAASAQVDPHAPVADFKTYTAEGVEKWEFNVNDPISFRDASGYGPTSWSWCLDWNDVAGTCALGMERSTQDVNDYIYSTPKDYQVRLQVFNDGGADAIVKTVRVIDPAASPSPTPTAAATETASPSPSPTPAPCQVPSFANHHTDEAKTLWESAGFTGANLTFLKTGNYFIGYQSLTGLSWVPCSSSIQVSDKAPSTR